MRKPTSRLTDAERKLSDATGTLQKALVENRLLVMKADPERGRAEHRARLGRLSDHRGAAVS